MDVDFALVPLCLQSFGALNKVCLYSSRDVVCWVPVGGIAGSCVGFIRAGTVALGGGGELEEASPISCLICGRKSWSCDL